MYLDGHASAELRLLLLSKLGQTRSPDLREGYVWQRTQKKTAMTTTPIVATTTATITTSEITTSQDPLILTCHKYQSSHTIPSPKGRRQRRRPLNNECLVIN